MTDIEKAIAWGKQYIEAGTYKQDYRADLMQKLLEIAEEKQQRWIPVSEKLPEEKINPVTCDYVKYNCTLDFGYGRLDVRTLGYGTIKGNKEFGDSNGGILTQYVIAWRPLPEPYREADYESSSV